MQWLQLDIKRFSLLEVLGGLLLVLGSFGRRGWGLLGVGREAFEDFTMIELLLFILMRIFFVLPGGFW